MTYSTVLFDLDGTLTDSGPGITRGVAYAMAAVGGGVLTDKQLRAFVGPPLPESFAAYGLDAERTQRAIARYREYFVATGIYENTVYPGIQELLAGLEATGTTMAVATSKPAVFARRIVEHFGLARSFTYVAGADLDGPVRHKHEVIARALDALGLEGGPEVCMVGDRAQDVAGAAVHGLSFVGAGWGYGEIGELAAAGASVIAAVPSDALGLLT
jgi:phosphoglycolate phosphatase